jgi:hypothetical protein
LAALALAVGAPAALGKGEGPPPAQTNGRYWSAPLTAATADGLLGR